jgi:hypothetical protein
MHNIELSQNLWKNFQVVLFMALSRVEFVTSQYGYKLKQLTKVIERHTKFYQNFINGFWHKLHEKFIYDPMWNILCYSSV